MKDKVDFKSPCPGTNCNSPDPDRIIEWSHAPCFLSEEWLDNEGNIICKSCDNSFFILDGRFACKYHENDYQEAGFTQLINALTVLQANPQLDESDLPLLVKVVKKIRAKAKEKGIIK